MRQSEVLVENTMNVGAGQMPRPALVAFDAHLRAASWSLKRA